MPWCMALLKASARTRNPGVCAACTGLLSSELPLSPVRTGTSSCPHSRSVLWCEGGQGTCPPVCCPDEKKKMLKALIMSYWVKDLVQKDKLDPLQVPHLL